MIKAKEEFLTVSEIFNAIRRRIVSVVVVAGCLCLLGLVALLMLRDTYSSEGEFYLNAGRGTVTIDPSATTSQTASLMDTRQSEIQSIKDMLGSRLMLERTARRVGIDRILEQRSWLSMQKEKFSEFIDNYLGLNDTLEEGLTAEQTAELERMQGAVEYIADRISISGDKEGNTVQVKAKAHTSLLAHDIVEALMTEFREQYVKVHRTVGSQNFFDEEYTSTVQRVREAEAELAAYKNKMKAISIESKRDLLHRESQVLQEDLLKTETEIVAKQAEIDRLDTLIEAEPVMTKSQATARSSAASDGMRGDLYKLEVAEAELASKYAESHPLLVKARQALNESRAAFGKQDSQFDESAESINPVRQELTITKLKAVSGLQALQARLASLEQSINENEQKIEQLNGDEIRVAELTRSVELIRDELKNYSQKREESRRQAELDEALISALQISQEATHVIKKSGPPRSIGLAIVVLLSSVFSCALAIYRESNNRLVNDDLSPVNGYRDHARSEGLHDLLARHAHNEDYTILSGRLPSATEGPLETTRGLDRKVKVHVTENIRG